MAATPVTFIDVYRIHAQDARELADMKLRLIGIKLYIHEAAPLIRWSESPTLRRPSPSSL